MIREERLLHPTFHLSVRKQRLLKSTQFKGKLSKFDIYIQFSSISAFSLSSADEDFLAFCPLLQTLWGNILATVFVLCEKKQSYVQMFLRGFHSLECSIVPLLNRSLLVSWHTGASVWSLFLGRRWTKCRFCLGVSDLACKCFGLHTRCWVSSQEINC